MEAYALYPIKRNAKRVFIRWSLPVEDFCEKWGGTPGYIRMESEELQLFEVLRLIAECAVFSTTKDDYLKPLECQDFEYWDGEYWFIFTGIYSINIYTDQKFLFRWERGE